MKIELGSEWLLTGKSHQNTEEGKKMPLMSWQAIGPASLGWKFAITALN
jgi:hypothetical protein